VWLGAVAQSIAVNSAEPTPIIKMGGVGLNVSDSERSKKFYIDVLTMKVAFVAPVGDKGSEVVMSKRKARPRRAVHRFGEYRASAGAGEGRLRSSHHQHE